MCHFREPGEWETEWRREREEEPDEEETPSFLNEERETDVELVTDGGGEE